MIDNFQLCTNRDDFIWDRAIWIATLEDGAEIWQDDDRPGVNEPSAWIRLGKYVKASGNRIVKMQLRFRTHIITLPKGKSYYFTKGILGSTASKSCSYFLCAGSQEGQEIDVRWYKTPELVETRMVTKQVYELHGQELIEGTNG